MTFPIRPFTDADYPAVVALWNRIYPENQLSEDELRDRDSRRAAHIRFQRFLVERGGALLAYGHYDQRADEYHPQKFILFLCARPRAPWALRHALGAHLLAQLQPHEPLAVYAIAREDMPNAALYPELGFEEVGRVWESRLDPRTVELPPAGTILAHLEAEGYTFHTLRELSADPQRDQKLYTLVTELEQDVPRPEPYTAPDFESFQRNALNHPDLLPDAYFVACHRGEYVGVSSLWQRAGNDFLETDLTAVRPEHRGRRLAFALKLAALGVAQERGQVVKTWNAAQNQAMLAINVRLGFVRQPAWIDFVRHPAPLGGSDASQ